MTNMLSMMTRYALAYVALAALVGVLALAAYALFDYAISGVIFLAIPALAAFYVGGRAGSADDNTFSSPEAWNIAFLMTGVTIVLNVLIIAAAWVFAPLEDTTIRTPLSVMMALFAVSVVITLLINRYFFAVGFTRAAEPKS